MSGKRKILVIDDDPLVAKTLKRLLDFHGYQTLSCLSGEEAIQHVKWEHFDVVLSDIRMPKMNGIRTVEEIQKIYNRSEISCRYIFFTGFAEEEAVEEAVQVAGTEVIIKPIDADKLLSVVDREVGQLPPAA